MEPKITLYDHENLKGRSKVFTESCPNMLDAGFDQSAVSVSVDGGVWVLFQNYEYTGKICVVMQGQKIKYLRWFNKMSRSLKLLDDYDFYAEPEICIFEHTFEGRTLTFRNDVANLAHYGFLRMISSVRILRGAWVGYDGRDYAGSQTLFLKGDYTPTQNPAIDGGFPNDGISALRKIQLFPVGPLKLKTIEYDLENAILHTTPRSVFQWTEVNDTKVEQTVNRTDEQKITRENTYEFRWDFGFKITTSLEATAGIPELGSSLKLEVSVERSLNIGETTGVKTSFIQQWTAEYPSKIPAKSTVTLTSKLTEGKFNVPFTATFYRGEDETHTEVHQGTFMGVQFTDFHTEFKQTPLNLKR